MVTVIINKDNPRLGLFRVKGDLRVGLGMNRSYKYYTAPQYSPIRDLICWGLYLMFVVGGL